jgi:2-aminoadipate transaminase
MIYCVKIDTERGYYRYIIRPIVKEESVMTVKFSKRSQYVRASEVRELLKFTERPEVISFAGGMPAPELFPIEEMKKVALAVLDEDGKRALQYSTTEGFIPLREEISKRMEAWSIHTPVEEIMITTGSQQGLDLSGKVFIDEGDAVICESPTYLAAINAFKSYLPRFVEVAMDEDGMIMEELEKALESTPGAKFIYTIPDFQNPTGRSMSLERRKRLVELANQYDTIIIEDNPYGELRFEGEDVPPVKYFDTEGRVVYLSTFSKILSPGLRMGWAAARPDIINKYVLFKQGADLHTSILDQMQAAKFVQMYDIEEHINKIREVYRTRRDLMAKTIREVFPDSVKVTHPKGGLFLWVELPENISARDVLVKCLDNNVAFVPGGSFFPNGGHENTFRLNFSNMPNDRIVEGIHRLAEVLNAAIE